MKKTLFGILLLIVIAAFTCLGFVILNKRNTKKILPTDQTGSILKAANAFLNSLTAEQRTKISFAFTQQKAAVSAKFARTNTPGGPGGAPQGNENKQGPPQGGGGGMPPQGEPPNGGGKGGQFPGFIGEQYGKAVWSNYPVSDVPRPGLKLGQPVRSTTGCCDEDVAGITECQRL
jgi:hypothetical protein